MRNTLETRLGIFVALAVIAAVLILEMVGGVERFRRGYRLHAFFETVQELKVGDRVKMAGVEIGRVENISLGQDRVRVTMKVRPDAQVKTDSVAGIHFTGLMGQNFVSIEFGSPGAPVASDGAVIASAEQPDFGVILKRLDNVAIGVENLTKSFTGDKIENLLGPFTDFLTANTEPLTATIANIESITTQISKGEGTVGRLIYDDTLHTAALSTVTNLDYAASEMRASFADVASELQVTIAEARKVVDQVNSGQGSIGKLLTDETLYMETTASMTNLREVLEKINKGDGTVGRLINDQEFYRNARMTLQKLDKATEGLEDQGPLSILGIAVNSLF
jgi:phospholipid/cholesterol/gamma-HCH transport system substrate-binding protein